MNRETSIDGCRIGAEDDVIWIGSSRTTGWVSSRASASKLIAFIQQWLDLDPDQDLIKEVNRLRVAGGLSETTPEIIAAVREHDRKYNP